VAQYRKKPVVVEAFMLKGDLSDERDWFEPAYYESASEEDVLVYFDDGSVSIKMLEGTMVARVGDWIIRGVRGEIYPCKPDIFEATYELVTP
jgi:hypothetical protein